MPRRSIAAALALVMAGSGCAVTVQGNASPVGAAGAAPAPGKTPAPVKSNAAAVELDKEAKKALARKQYELGKELNSLERQIEKHGQRKQEFEDQLKAATSNADVVRIQGALAELKKKLAPIEARWVEVQEELEKK